MTINSYSLSPWSTNRNSRFGAKRMYCQSAIAFAIITWIRLEHKRQKRSLPGMVRLSIRASVLGNVFTSYHLLWYRCQLLTMHKALWVSHSAKPWNRQHRCWGVHHLWSLYRTQRGGYAFKQCYSQHLWISKAFPHTQVLLPNSKTKEVWNFVLARCHFKVAYLNKRRRDKYVITFSSNSILENIGWIRDSCWRMRFEDAANQTSSNLNIVKK